MHRLDFLTDEPWDEQNDDDRTRVRVEEMFFVLDGTLTVRTPEGEEQLSPGDVVYFPEGPDGLHDFSNPTDEPVRLLAVSSKRFPDVVAYPDYPNETSRCRQIHRGE